MLRLGQAVADMAFAVLEEAERDLAASGFVLSGGGDEQLRLGVDFAGLVWVWEDDVMSFALRKRLSAD